MGGKSRTSVTKRQKEQARQQRRIVKEARREQRGAELLSVLVGIMVSLFRPAKQRRQHLLQAGDEVVRFPCPLSEVLDLLVLHADLLS